MDAANASVSQTYDAQKDSELVLQGGTESTSKVSQSNKQSANSNILHGIPDPQPLTPPQDTTEGEKKEMRMEEASNGRLVGMKEGRL